MKLICNDGSIIPVSNKSRGLLHAYFRFLGNEDAKYFTVHVDGNDDGLKLYKEFVKIMHCVFDGFPKLDLETRYDDLTKEIEVIKIVRSHRGRRKEICKRSKEGNPGTEKEPR